MVVEKMIDKGFVFSLIVLLFGLLLFSLSSSFYSNSASFEDNLKYFMGIERVSFKFENFEDNIYDILTNAGGLSWKLVDSNVYFMEKLPGKKGKGTFTADLDKYAQFASQYNDGLDVNIASDEIDSSVLNILPFDVNYMHSDKQGGGWKNDNEIFFNPSEINFSGYFVEITLLNQNYTSINESYKTCSGSCSTPISFLLVVKNSNKIVQVSSSNNNLDSDKQSVVIINTSGSASNDIRIEIGPGGVLHLENSNSVSIDVNSGINFGNQGELPYVTLANGLVKVKMPQLNIEKN